MQQDNRFRIASFVNQAQGLIDKHKGNVQAALTELFQGMVDKDIAKMGLTGKVQPRAFVQMVDDDTVKVSVVNLTEARGQRVVRKSDRVEFIMERFDVDAGTVALVPVDGPADKEVVLPVPQVTEDFDVDDAKRIDLT